jgi:hypothetical protein
LLVGGLLVAALVVSWTDRWRKRRGTDSPSSGEQLTHFRALYEKGELSREEFERIRSRLGQQIRKDLNVPQRPPPESPPAEPSQPDL